MIKRILPIHLTGWFYLFLLFWAISFWYITTGGLNQLNQFNIHLLSLLKPAPLSSVQSAAVEKTNIVTLHSTFKEEDIVPIATLLSLNPQSQITFLGQPSALFITGLNYYLDLTPRQNKIVISSPNTVAEQRLALKPAVPFSSPLNWLRFSSKENIEQLQSSHFIFSPWLISQRKSFGMLWQNNRKPYLSVPGEILKQLSSNDELTLKLGWKLSLLNQANTKTPKEFSLGFLGEVFIADNLIHHNDNDAKKETSLLKPVSQFINVSRYSKAPPADDYAVIIISNGTDSNSSLLQLLLIKLLQQDYLYQNLTTLIFAWLLLFAGLTLLWLIRNLPIKNQLICLGSFTLLLFLIQYGLVHQQQWLEVIPLIMAVTGTWLLLLGYQKEYKLFLAVFNQQTSVSHTQGASSAAITNENQKNTAWLDDKTPRANHKRLETKGNIDSSTAIAIPAEDLEQTLVIVNSAMQGQSQVKHHLTVENFGRYQIEGILGRGAMGIVYQGVDPKINRHVAIKTLQLSDDIDSPEFSEAKERFFREAQTAGGLSHANIVTIYDVGEENNLGYIAMDLLTGAPLSLFTQPDQTLPIPLVYQLLIQITDALDYAHKQNVVHRDIKPANIIYDDDLLKVTVTDFGIAYVSDNSKTRTGIIMGSPYYMSPEQILGLKVDGRSDIFSLGVTFYQLLCGYLPFEGESIATVAYQITKAKAIAVNQRNTKLPSSAMRICNKAMHKDIEKRYQSMAEFKLALTSALKRDFKVTVN